MFAQSYDSILFVGTGGGNDIFSTILAKMCARAQGVRWKHCDIAGVISPFHRHTLAETRFPGVLRTSRNSARFLTRRGDERRINFVDRHVAELVSEGECGALSVYALSLERGSEGLAESFAALAKEYETIVLVDVGGDVFYSGHDPHVLSPMFDAMTLRGFVDSGASGFLFEAGPGTDGEIEPEALVAVLEHVGALQTACAIPEAVIDRWENLFRRFIEPHRAGNTVPGTIRAYRASEQVISMRARARSHLGDIKRYAEYEHRIFTDLCKSYYLVDPKRIVNPFAVPCSDPLEWFMATQVLQKRTNCEANLEYLNLGTHIVQLLTPSPLLAQPVRDELLLLGLEELRNGVADVACVFPDDWDRVWDRIPEGLEVEEGTLMNVTRK